jgi:hypothetical protein
MARGQRVEALLLRDWAASGEPPRPAVLVTDRGVLPPVPDAPRGRGRVSGEHPSDAEAGRPRP